MAETTHELVHRIFGRSIDEIAEHLRMARGAREPQGPYHDRVRRAALLRALRNQKGEE